MPARRSENFLVIKFSFKSELLKVLVVQLVRKRYMHFIPAVATRLVSADQQNRNTPQIVCIQRAVRSATMLNTKFAHVAML